jgi:ribosomal protein L29
MRSGAKSEDKVIDEVERVEDSCSCNQLLTRNNNLSHENFNKRVLLDRSTLAVMTHHELQKTIVELRAELVHLTEDNDRTKVHVRQLIATLERHLNNPANEDKTLLENISSTIERLEVDHPRVTLILNQMMSTLSGSGI